MSPLTPSLMSPLTLSLMSPPTLSLTSTLTLSLMSPPTLSLYKKNALNNYTNKKLLLAVLITIKTVSRCNINCLISPKNKNKIANKLL